MYIVQIQCYEMKLEEEKSQKNDWTLWGKMGAELEKSFEGKSECSEKRRKWQALHELTVEEIKIKIRNNEVRVSKDV